MGTDIADRFDGLLYGGDEDVNLFYRDARSTSPIFWSDAFNGYVVSKYDGADFTDGVPPNSGFVFQSPAHVRVCPHK